jgi:hypothetical protein
MYSQDELFALAFAGFAALHSWGTFIAQAVAIRPYRYQNSVRFPLYCGILLSGTVLYYVISFWSSHDVRDSQLYTFFYLILGAGWLGFARYAMAYLGLCPRYDVLERNNPAAGWACGGALVGIMLCFAGGNIGDGPGWWVVIYCAALSTGTAAVAWIILDSITRAADNISVERDVATGLRAAGFWIAAGVILGRAVAGDWISLQQANIDFIKIGWPMLILLVGATALERPLRPGGNFEQTSVLLKGVAPGAFYVFCAILYVASISRP